MSSAAQPLRIDARRAVERLEAYVRDLVNQRAARGVLIGLSGGIDSALLTTLAVRALDRERVHVCHLFDRDSERASRRRARRVAHWLGLQLEVQDMEPALRKKQVYAHVSMRLTALSGFANRYLGNSLYRLIFRETPFMSTLRRGRFGNRRFQRLFYDVSVRRIEAAFNARHIHRREILEKRARDGNLLLLGAANRSEAMTGWFVKGGIDDVAFQPLIGLYKTQVRQLSPYLGMPAEIQDPLPSPDMIKGIGDEAGIGIRYSRLDVILDALDRGLPDEEIVASGIGIRELSLVREMNRLSSWKRESEHAPPPVEGGLKGGLRIPSSEGSPTPCTTRASQRSAASQSSSG